MFIAFHSIVIHNSKKKQYKCPSTHVWLNIVVVYPHSGLFSHKKEWNTVLGYMNESWKHPKERNHTLKDTWNVKNRQFHRAKEVSGCQWMVVIQSLICLWLFVTHELQHIKLPILHCLPEFVQTHVHWVSDAIQPSHPLPPPSPALNLSQHQGGEKWKLELIANRDTLFWVLKIFWN